MTHPTAQQIREAADTLQALQEPEGHVMPYSSLLPDDLRRIADIAESADAKAAAREALTDELLEDLLGTNWKTAGGWFYYIDQSFRHEIAKLIELGWTKSGDNQ
jgi:hypothetical protein